MQEQISKPEQNEMRITNAMNEWGFMGKDIFVVLGKSATIHKFKTRRGYVREERLSAF